MMAGGRLSLRQARWLAIEAQGLAGPRPNGRIERRHVRSVVDRIGTIQLDAVNVLQRTQFMVLFSRLGSYDVTHLHDMTGPGGELFEYWGHAASLLAATTQPLFRWRMNQYGTGTGGGVYGAARRAWRESEALYIAAVLEEVRDRGPLAASGLTDPRRGTGDWWERRGAGRQALEWLFSKGELAAWRTVSFERVYDLPERVIPKEILAEPTPTPEAAHRSLVAMAARSLGVATVGDLGDYYRLRPTQAKAAVATLVERGELVRVTVEGWPQPAYCPPGVRPRRPGRARATLLSPFDSLIWERDRTERLFGFEYRIEVYVPAPKRRFGYYVLPLLLGDELVARFDLKADRKESTLKVSASHLEAGADGPTVAHAAAAELDALRQWLRLEGITVSARGDLAAALQHALG